jgi:predicted nucleic acid-binding protein
MRELIHEPPPASDFLLNAWLGLAWFLEDETNRKYSLGVLAGLSDKRALVPLLCFYEVGTALLMARRHNRITVDQIEAFLTARRIFPATRRNKRLLRFSNCSHPPYSQPTNDAAYLALAQRANLPLPATDSGLGHAAASARVKILAA